MAVLRDGAARSVAAACVAAALGLLGGALVVPAPARAHGAPADPISRTLACGPAGGAAAKSAACRAALAASGGPGAFETWDYLRVPGVNGRDREVIPDGRLCSGGLDTFRGLDLPRTDWPSTTLTAGARYTFRYVTTIEHPGSFRMFVTRDGYRPTRALRWADLEARPFLTADNPPVDGDAYVMKGKLPAGRTGRHIIYTIWQNEGPDTYYSCSDVVFKAADGGAGATPSASAAVKAAPTGPAEDPVGTPAALPRSRNESTSGLLLTAGGVAAAIGAAAAIVLYRSRRRPVGRRRASRHHRP
jgi:chitin-binding protein